MIDFDALLKGDSLFDGHYKLIRQVSTDGATADVWLAVDVNTIDKQVGETWSEAAENTGMLVAIKIYRPKNALDIEGEQRFRDEFKIVYECRHANLLQPTAFDIYKDAPYLVLPYCRYGSSEQLIGKKMAVSEIWKFIHDVAAGLNRLHTNTPQIVHQDIKPANILIDNSHNYAITDFGISSTRGGGLGHYYDENSGTFAYMAPERFIQDSEPMPQSDIWAFGATLFEILTGKVPFGEEGGQAQSSSGSSIPSISGIPVDIQRLLHACLDKEPGNRPTAQQILEASRSRQFPKKKKWPLVLISLLAVIAAIVLYQLQYTPKDISITEEYEIALANLLSEDMDDFYSGYNKMDSLSKIEYVPAMYEMAMTRGWDSSEESLRRKGLLGIKVDEKKQPLSDIDNQATVYLLNKILEKRDSLYPQINAYAAYRLAGYYVNDNPLFKSNAQEAKAMLYLSKDWAIMASDAKTLRDIGDWASRAGDEKLLNEVESALINIEQTDIENKI